jgi:hypothetical protein
MISSEGSFGDISGGDQMPLSQMGLAGVVMLAWGLPLTWLTLRLLRVTDDTQGLIAGSFLAFGYGLLAVPLLHWIAF